MCRAALPVVLCVAALALVVASAPAQVTEVPTFQVAEPSTEPPDVAGGTDGSIVVIWTEFEDFERYGYTRKFSASGAPLTSGTRIDTTADVRATAISPFPDGTFIAAWYRSFDGASVYGRRLDATGAPLGAGFKVTADDRSLELRSVVGLPAGSVFLWRQRWLRMRAYDALDAPRAPEVLLSESLGSSYADAAALPDGGYIVVSADFAGVGSNGARFYDGDGTPRGPAFSLGSGFRPRRVAVSPLGDIMVVGIGTGFSGSIQGSVMMRRLNVAGELIGPAKLVRQSFADELWVPDVELDSQGNALVVWSGRDDPDNFGSAKVRGRAFNANNAPLGHEFLVADEYAEQVRVARMADGHFAVTWNSQVDGVSAKVLSLCLPGVATCGDGVVHPECEQCDDGAGNSDSAPDACRTDCSLPRCGDAATDSGEQCDDGNLTSCDGCSDVCVSEPGLVCGDGLPEPSCSQPCDDANATVGDGCTSQCGLEVVPGTGSPVTDCRSVWVVDNPSNDPLVDKHGVFRNRQRCTDDDAQCDFDGGTPGGCTFHVRVCANASGLPECVGGSRIAAWTLDKPSAKQAAKSPALAAVRESFTPVPGVVVGPSESDVCTDWLSVVVPLKGAPGDYKKGKVDVKSRAIDYDDVEDKDKLKLECMPTE